MALAGADKAYLHARSGIARSGASRSNYVVPLFAVVTVGGVDLTDRIQYGSLLVNMALNDQPDTATFEVYLDDAAAQAALVVGADVRIGLGGPAENLLFGGRILTTHTRRGPARTASVRSVLCADYLQVLDSEYLITYGWPAQSATATIRNLITLFANNPGGVAISTAGVQAGLPNHAAFTVVNERFSTVLRRLVTLFPAGGGFYVDPAQVLHVWAGASEPNIVHPAPLTLDNPRLKQFAETVDGSHVRDAVIVEGMRTSAPIGTPVPTGGILESVPVVDASVFLPAPFFVPFEVRIGSQRFRSTGVAEGAFMQPANTPQTTTVTATVGFFPGPGTVTIPVESDALVTGRAAAWVRIEDQYLKVVGQTSTSLVVPRTGYGAVIGPIPAGANVTAIDSLGSLQVTGRYTGLDGGIEIAESFRAQPIEADVVMVVRTATAPEIHEHLVQDGRYSKTGATNRGTQEIADFKLPLTSITFESDDLNARPGRRQAYSFSDAGLAPMAGEYLILTAALSWPVWGEAPRRVCEAAAVQTANVVDTWLSDPR